MGDPIVPFTAPVMDGTNMPQAHLKLDVLIQQVRSFLRDYPELNRLTSGVESSNRQILWAIMDTLDDFNSSPPFTSVGLDNFPSMSLLVRGTTCSLLESIGLLQTRNHLSWTDGGIQINTDRTPYIQSWLQMFRNSYEEKKSRIKISMNIEGAWGGGVHSEFVMITSWYGSW